MLGKRIYSIYPLNCAYVSKRMTHPIGCVLEYQYETADAAWARHAANRLSMGVSTSRDGYVAVVYIGTGTKTRNGVDQFVPDWKATTLA